MTNPGPELESGCSKVDACKIKMERETRKITSRWRGSVMNSSGVVASQERVQVLNVVPLSNAVLCAECEVVSDSPHDLCMVCGSRSLFNISRVFGGKLPQQRASLVAQTTAETSSCELVPFPKPHRVRRRAIAGSRQLAVLALDHSETDEVERGALLGPKGR
jgi:hypothetical protein